MGISNSIQAPAVPAPDEIRVPSIPPRVVLGGRALDEPVLVRLRAYINKHGVGPTAIKLGMPRQTIANAAAGAGMRTATRLLLADRLRAVEATR